ncbi:preprotein translocase [Methanosarcina sp. 1.H.T.1A.1]|jgi:sec-independent protein translocase protein TatA|nr:twin-arginine translocase TatA/TatE family subunit [Methanosarcina sp. 1.H.T.1A.1]KKH94256.1 preprotein translocase [Methanosarcina sp. 1.H.T.1A.1]
MIGSMELIAILIAALFLFGPRKLPELARSLGSAVGEFKKAQRAAELELTTFDSYTRETESGAVPGVKEDEKDIINEAPKTKTRTDQSLKNSLEARSSIPDIENHEASGTNGKIPE